MCLVSTGHQTAVHSASTGAEPPYADSRGLERKKMAGMIPSWRSGFSVEDLGQAPTPWLREREREKERASEHVRGRVRESQRERKRESERESEGESKRARVRKSQGKSQREK
eukprot:3939724-Rhodomonas_salina.2